MHYFRAKILNSSELNLKKSDLKANGLSTVQKIRKHYF